MPRLRSQFEAPNPDPNDPRFGRDEMDHAHAIFSIAQSLVSLGLADWLPTMLHWLGHYDGLEILLEDPFDPAICVRQVLLQHVVEQSAVGPTDRPVTEIQALKQAIVEDLMKLDFVCFRVYFGTLGQPRVFWAPLEQSFLSFKDGQQGDEYLRGWYTEKVEPIARRLSHFLLTGTLAADPECA